jgi:P4 family phage/plasmid primase-like protien
MAMVSTSAAEDQIRQYFTFAWKPVRLERASKKPHDAAWQENWISEEQAIAWFDQGENIGIQVGAVSNWICCVDLDSDEAVRLAPAFLPDTLTAGKEADERPTHYIYRSEGAGYLKIAEGTKEVLALKASADGAGHQFVVAPSVHPTKGRYVWTPSFNPAAIADVGAERLTEAVRRLGLAALILQRLPTEGRHDYSLAIAGTLLRRGYAPGDLEHIFEVVWKAAGAPGGAVKQAVKNVRDTAGRIADQEPIKADNALREVSESLLKPLLAAAGVKHFVGTGQEGTDEPGKPDDDELARQWLFKHRDLRSSPHGWMRYRDGCWSRVEDGLITQNVTRHLSRLPGIKVSANRVGSVVKLAEHHSYVPANVWDAKDDVIVCTNGTLDLNTFELRDHRPEDYVLGGLPFAYDPSAEAEAWGEFLGGRLGDSWPFLQEFAGYCLTTDTSHEVALWLLGEGGTGKSTFIEGVLAICGDRAGRLGLSDIERSSFALENVVGKTLLTATEQPSMYIKQVDILNTLISGEVLSINRKNKPIVDVRTTAKLLWAMNSEPKMREEGNGIFRRVQIVKFPPLEGPPNPLIKERIMKLEPPGILNWAIEGLRRLRERGYFVIPEATRVAVEEFEKANDPPAQFLEEMCERGDFRTPRKELYNVYRRWCIAFGYKPKAVAAVKHDWLRLKLEERTVNGKGFYHGVRVAEDPDIYLGDNHGW